jgi:hypothetical protein
MFKYKWGMDPQSERLFDGVINGTARGDGKGFMMYPYFEKDILDLNDKYTVY